MNDARRATDGVILPLRSRRLRGAGEACCLCLHWSALMLGDAADYRSMDTAIKRYVAEVRNAGKRAISFFYYSGHGVANPDTQINYLIPVDVSYPSDASLWYQSFQQNDVIDKLSRQAPNATHYVVFDACRNELNLSGSAAKALGGKKALSRCSRWPDGFGIRYPPSRRSAK